MEMKLSAGLFGGMILLFMGYVLWIGQQTANLAKNSLRTGFENEALVRKLSFAHKELVEANRLAEDASFAKSNFLATMSHELRTPLNAILGFSDTIRIGLYGDINERQKERLDDIHNSGGFLLDLINDILDLSKIEAGKVELNIQDVDIAEVVDRAIRLTSLRAEECGIRLSTDVPQVRPLLRADDRILLQMMLNLLSNGIKFSPNGGLVGIDVILPMSGGMHIEVRDTGIGIDHDDIEKALTPFGQIETAMARKFKGTGLGLPLVKELIELSGGGFELESERGVGTTVRLIFPNELCAQAVDTEKMALVNSCQ
jgi:signal transduction histidine kinase